MNRNVSGTLYIVATPIGNLQDISQRALSTLKTVDGIAAEDTRHSAQLLRHYNIATPLISLHEHNERERTQTLLERLNKGESIALISDAGTPLISDPGSLLVKSVLAAGISVVPIPGACALIAALSASGFPSDRFVFEGFLPGKSPQRLKALEALRYEPRTLVFYEAPHRISATLKDMQTIFGDEREAGIARELTKLYETIRVAPLKTLVEWVGSDENQRRGEQVILLQGATDSVTADVDTDRLLKIFLTELPLKQAVDLTVKITGIRRNTLYQQALLLLPK